MLTQDDYKLYTGETTDYSADDWEKLVSIAAVRLAGFLCLENLSPAQEGALTAQEYDALKLLASVYDSMKLTAYQYDRYGKELLTGSDTPVLPADLAMLLANFLCLMLTHRGNDDQITSKRVRNFSINYGSDAANAFAKLERNYGDIIAKYSQCGTGVCVECNARRCCYGHF